ncbi:unnamed protein product [Brachionus calyciflorus]|uniref:FLYWCH-type domain-containing protein n=1 Tax=Brachionus calyciflorus TaxID=104777 RepID=A0A813UKL7_9BILA|nr:unnamed protein product [Brachionus calyciflorus]
MDKVSDAFNKLSISSKISLSDFKATITPSQKKAPQLHHLGYYYKKSYSNQSSGKISWRCVKNNSKASVYSNTDKVGDNCDFHILHEEHLDEPNMSKIYLLERRRFIKVRAANSDDKARKIVSQACFVNFLLIF